MSAFSVEPGGNTFDSEEDEPEYETTIVFEENLAFQTSTVGDVRFVEFGLVAMALVLWVGAIILFFHRWGKIRMLLPYQPDYRKEEVGAACNSCTKTQVRAPHLALLSMDSRMTI